MLNHKWRYSEFELLKQPSRKTRVSRRFFDFFIIDKKNSSRCWIFSCWCLISIDDLSSRIFISDSPCMSRPYDWWLSVKLDSFVWIFNVNKNLIKVSTDLIVWRNLTQIYFQLKADVNFVSNLTKIRNASYSSVSALVGNVLFRFTERKTIHLINKLWNILLLSSLFLRSKFDPQGIFFFYFS